MAMNESGPPARRSPAAPAQAPRSTGAFDGTTTYGANYHPHQLPEKPHFSAPAPRKQVPFDGTTTTQDAYKAYDVQPRQVYGPAATARPHVPFDAHTTNQARAPTCMLWTAAHVAVCYIVL